MKIIENTSLEAELSQSHSKQMNTSKNSKKNLWTKLLLVPAFIAILLFAVAMTKIESPQREEEPKEVFVEEQKSSVYYAEEGDDLEYNYIANPQALKKVQLSNRLTLELPLEIDRQLKIAGYTDCSLTVKNVHEKGVEIHFDIAIGDTKSVMSCTIDKTTNTISAYIRE